MSERKVFDVPEVLKALKSVVEREGPDHTVEECEYRSGNDPCCIVGCALDLLGILPSAQELNARSVNPETGAVEQYPANHGLFTNVASQFKLPLTTNAVLVMRRAQAIQDLGGPWGHAIEVAQKFAKELGYE